MVVCVCDADGAQSNAEQLFSRRPGELSRPGGSRGGRIHSASGRTGLGTDRHHCRGHVKHWSGTANQAVSSGMSFATTYALGHVAKRYYAGGRTLSTQLLKDAYADVVQEAQGLQTRYLPEMRDKARSLDAGSVLSMVRKA
jgi:hypothetical protein